MKKFFLLFILSMCLGAWGVCHAEEDVMTDSGEIEEVGDGGSYMTDSGEVREVSDDSYMTDSGEVGEVMGEPGETSGEEGD